ncbi:hypothetical protein V8E36_001057 [Tilletia maclaganii]
MPDEHTSIGDDALPALHAGDYHYRWSRPKGLRRDEDITAFTNRADEARRRADALTLVRNALQREVEKLNMDVAADHGAADRIRAETFRDKAWQGRSSGWISDNYASYAAAHRTRKQLNEPVCRQFLDALWRRKAAFICKISGCTFPKQSRASFKKHKCKPFDISIDESVSSALASDPDDGTDSDLASIIAAPQLFQLRIDKEPTSRSVAREKPPSLEVSNE